MRSLGADLDTLGESRSPLVADENGSAGPVVFGKGPERAKVRGIDPRGPLHLHRDLEHEIDLQSGLRPPGPVPALTGRSPRLYTR